MPQIINCTLHYTKEAVTLVIYYYLLATSLGVGVDNHVGWLLYKTKNGEK